MRLLNTSTFDLKSFTGQQIPEYAILSHTWGKDEILFEDVKFGPAHIPQAKPGFSKVRDSCKKAQLDGYQYIWIDTCCIDKSSSAELSEAINSMFKWYHRSAVCYAYLADYDAAEINDNLLRDCKWFTRGWTLQELIAPAKVEFYNANWKCLGIRDLLASRLASITGISTTVLGRASGCRDHSHAQNNAKWCIACGNVLAALSLMSIAAKMSWASERQTTRGEDMAYCLMGLFEVNMPLLYGEGPEKAFQRLQEEIVKTSTDQSLFTFSPPWSNAGPPGPTRLGPLAARPAQFRGLNNIAWQISTEPDLIAAVAGGVSLKVILCPCTVYYQEYPERRSHYQFIGDKQFSRLALLDSFFEDDFLARPGIVLSATDDTATAYFRAPYGIFRIETEEKAIHTSSGFSTSRSSNDDGNYLAVFSLSECRLETVRIMHFKDRVPYLPRIEANLNPPVTIKVSPDTGYTMIGSFPPSVNGIIPSLRGYDPIWLGSSLDSLSRGRMLCGSKTLYGIALCANPVDKFFVVWGSNESGHEMFDLAISKDRYGWWVATNLLCCIVECSEVGYEDGDSLQGDLRDIYRGIGDNMYYQLELTNKLSTCQTSRRSGNCTVDLQIRRVEFFGRTSYVLELMNERTAKSS
ncbi:heterokaryon incompatibility protein-domain-containing protein [Xylariaceae sp. FL1651]|nr:heterokaryon incompatibility protein-domain-containing protein [Xylariaceae sp. FL1651]